MTPEPDKHGSVSTPHTSNSENPPVPLRRWVRVRELALGFLTWKVADYAFDYVLYPAVVFRWGPVWGGLTMSILSLIFCLSLLRLYDRLGRDWLGIEFIKGLHSYTGNSLWKRWMGWLLRRGDLPAFFVLSVKYDPFITTAYLRRVAFEGMARRDWWIFLGSWIVGNASWTIIVFGGLSAFAQVWKWLLS